MSGVRPEDANAVPLGPRRHYDAVLVTEGRKRRARVAQHAKASKLSCTVIAD